MQLIFRFPYARHTWESPMALDDARAALAAQMADVPFFRSAGAKPLRGRCEGQRFRCARVTGYRNFFLPIVSGTLSQGDAGTRVEILLRAPLFGSLFLGAWTLGIVAVLVGVALGRATGDAARLGALTMPLLAIGIAIAGFSFGSEALETERLLKRCLRVSER